MQFSPSIYEHAAALIGKTPRAVSRSADLLFQAHAKAFHLYNHDPVVVGIDIYNVEAEAYGAAVSIPESNDIPAISGHACPDAAAIRKLKPLNPKKDGRIPMVLETGRRLARACPEAHVRIPVSGPFSLASNLMGFERLLCDVLDDPASVKESLLHLARGQIAFCSEIVEQGLGIAFFESAATPPLISPEMFARMELPALQLIVSEASAMAGEPVPCVIGGDTAPILDSILATGTRYVICPCETDQAAFMRKMRAHPEVLVRINTTLQGFALGDMASIYRELDRVMALAGQRDKVCIGTGALPFETNPAVVLKAKSYVCG